MATVKKHYINNKQLLEAIKEYQADRKRAEEDGRQEPEVPRQIGAAIMQICFGVCARHNFRGYSYNDEMYAEGMMDCVVGAKYFDTERFSSPFAYFTQIAWYAALRVIAKEKKQSYIKVKSMQEQELKSVLAGEGITADSKEFMTSDSANELVRSFESKRDKGKKGSLLRKKKK